ncbi:MAG: DUF3369 domain-containing protein [Spirochaetales bacterium]|nr:DUF3369 domain-containing protein [Spirochaetales bacterium]
MTGREYWNILIVDDEREIHQVTELVLDSLQYRGLPISCLHAFSADEARDILSTEPDIAVVLLDVVMESESAGLELAKWIREEAKMTALRIILRTGQPGQAPQMEVIRAYDINDYKEKTELTARKLTTVVISSLRSYEQVSEIEKNKADLEKIIRGTSQLFEVYTLNRLSKNILNQFNDLLRVHSDLSQRRFSGVSLEKNRKGIFVLGSVGDFEGGGKKEYPRDFTEEEQLIIEEVAAQKRSILRGRCIATYFVTHNEREGIMLLKGDGPLPAVNLDIITLFSVHVSVAFDSYQLNKEIRDTRQEILDKLWQVIETRLSFNRGHVRRVYHISNYIGFLLELPDRDSELLRYASSFHDIGLVGLSDEMLQKPFPLSPEDHRTFMRHTDIGHALLSTSARKALKVAADVALQHHESWDGTGYPGNLSGEEIHPLARIIRVADVIDFYGKNYPDEEWTEPALKAFLVKESGRMFDPAVIEQIIDHVDIIMKLRDEQPVTAFEDARV